MEVEAETARLGTGAKSAIDSPAETTLGADANAITIETLCQYAASLGAVVVTVGELPSGALAQAQTPNFCTLTLPEFDVCLNAEEKRALYAHVRDGGCVILLSREAADDATVLAHEMGHVAAFHANCDRDDRKPTPKLVRRAQRCGMDERAVESKDELMAECVAWRILELPLSPPLRDFCESTFSQFVGRSGWKSRYGIHTG